MSSPRQVYLDSSRLRFLSCSPASRGSCIGTATAGGSDEMEGREEAVFEAVFAVFAAVIAESTLALAAVAMLRHFWVTKKV